MPNKIPKHKKNVYLRRAKRQARRQFAPQRQLIRRQQRRLRRQRSTDLASVGGAIDQFSDVVAQAQAGLADSGLKGRYLKQTASELGSRAADAAQSAPDLRAQIRSEYQPEFASIRDALASSRIEQSQTAESTFRTMLEERQKAIADRQEARGGDRAERQEAIATGLQAIDLNHTRNLRLVNTPDSELDAEALAKKNEIQAALEDPDYYWKEVTARSMGEGVTPLQAARAAAIYRKQNDQNVASGFASAATAGVGSVLPQMVANQNPGLYELYRRLQGG